MRRNTHSKADRGLLSDAPAFAAQATGELSRPRDNQESVVNVTPERWRKPEL